MKSNTPFFGISRRAVLSALSVLSALTTIRPVSAIAQASGPGNLPSASPASRDLPGDVLPSWNDTTSKNAIIAFVDRVTKQGSPDFVPEPERIATFDNDGTLWAEQPLYTQVLFALDRSKGESCAGVTKY